MLFPKIGFCSLFLGIALLASSATATFLDEEGEEKQATLHAERFLSILEKNPQRGTALEKIFVHHLQRGTLDSFIQSLEKRTQVDPNDSSAWMLLGLFESHRRFDSQAIIAFAQAEKLRSEDALPAFYRGQCLLRTGEPAAAIEAFEAAILRKPTRMVMLELYEQIGRTHLRQNRNDLALECWKRLEAMFPDDLRVLEQIASVQKQEGGLQDALLKYERLIALAKDAYQRTQFRIEATQLQIQLGERDKGLASLTTILSELKPDGWLFRDVQRKIEDVFLAVHDRAGLIQFYESRLLQSPDDIESMVRLAKFLTQASRVAEANQWMTQAIERAPSRLEIRRTLIELLISDQQISAAIEQYRQLSKLDPTNLDALREWGKLMLRDTTLTLDEGKKEASRIWHKMLESKTDDALLHVQIAELLMSAQIPGEAEKLFERAIQLAPDENQYREYFGDFLLQQNRREEAFAVWDAIAQGERRNASNLLRLAEIYQHAKVMEKSVSLANQACELAPKEPMVFIRAAKMQSKAQCIDDALKSLSIAESLADNAEQRESIILDRTDILEKTNRLKQEADILQSQLRTVEKSDISKLSQRQLLVRYLVRLNRWQEAQFAVIDALGLEGKSLSMLTAASDIADGMGDVPKSIETLRKLAEIDRRRRHDYLQKIARLQIREGKPVDAIETAKEVVLAFPSKLESYEFMAQICFQANNRDLGIETLRKAFRIDANSMNLTIALGNALADGQKYSEAIELYWQSLVKANKLDDKIDLTTRLAKLHQLQSGTASVARNVEGLLPLIDRLELAKQDPTLRQDFVFCLSQVYQSVSDYANAQRVLEELLTDRARDSNVLQQLSKVCADAGNLEKAIDYQQQLVAMLPGQDTESQLANLLRQNGDWSQANIIVMKLLQSERDPAAILQNIDSLMQKGERELVLQSLDPMLRKQPDNWELLFRKGLALAGIDEWVQSQATMEQILELEADRSDIAFRSSSATDKKNRRGLESNASGEHGVTFTVLAAAKEWETIARSELLDIAIGRGGFIDNALERGNSNRWYPRTYGEVRWACIACLVCADAKAPQRKSKWLEKADERQKNAPSNSVWIDALAIAKFKQDLSGQIQAIANLIERGEKDMNRTFLEIVQRRQVSDVASENKIQRPLSSSQIELLKTAYESVKDAPTSTLLATRNATPSIRQWPSYANSVQYAPQTSFAGQSMLGSFPGSRSPQKEGALQAVINELRLAGQVDESEVFLTRLVDIAQTEWQFANLCEFFLGTDRFKNIEKPLVRWLERQLSDLRDNRSVSIAQAGGLTTGVAATVFSLEQPTDFAYRFIDKHGDDVSPECLVRAVELAADISDQQFRNRTLVLVKPGEVARAAVLAITQNQNQGLMARQSLTKLLAQSWSGNFVSERLHNLLLTVGKRTDLSNLLQKRIERAEGIAKPLAKLHLVLSHSSEVQSEDDEKQVVDALRDIGNDSEHALIAATALMIRKNHAEARMVAENFNTEDLQDKLSRELIILFSSASLNDNVRVEASLKLLSSYAIDDQTAQSIFYVLQQSSVKDIAKNSVLRAKVRSRGVSGSPQGGASAKMQTRTVSPSQPMPALTAQEARVQEMAQLSSAGKHAEAVKIARQIVSQPRVFPVATVPMAMQSFAFQRQLRSSNTQSINFNELGNLKERKTAFDVLKTNRELEKLITETQHLLEAAPNSYVRLEQMAELYEHTEPNRTNTEPNGQIEAEKYLTEALRVRPNASRLRLHFAELLQNSRKFAEACEQYLELIRRDTILGLIAVGESQIAFQICGRTEELRNAIREANFHSVQDRTTLLGMGNAMIKSGKGFEVGATLLEKLIQVDKTLFREAIMNAYYPDEVVYPRLLRFTRDALVPNENEVADNPWFGLDSIMAQRVSESFFFRKIILCHSKEDVAGELRSSIQVAVDRFPGWLAGQVMLAMIAERLGESELKAKLLTSLSKNKKLFMQCPETVAYELAKLFVERPETRMVAIKLLEPLCESRQFLSYDAKDKPAMILAKAWLADGQRAKAIAVLTNETQSMQTPMGPSSLISQPPIVNGKTVPSVSIAEQMLILGLPIDSYRLIEIPKSGLPRTRDTQEYSAIANALKTARQKAIYMFEKMPAERAIAELLLDRAIAARQLPALELMFHVPSLREVSGQSAAIESVLQNALVRHAKAGMLPVIEDGLQKLGTAYPKDLTVLATQAIVRLEMGSANATEALEELERVLSEFDLQINDFVALADRSDSNLQVPGNMNSIVSTWLVARQCYVSGTHFDVAERIGNRAVKAAGILDEFVIRSRPTPEKNNPVVELGPEAELASIILFEWGRTEIRRGRMEKGSLKWKELADRICSMNDGKLLLEQVVAENVSEKGSKELIWQREPFEWMMLLANSALDVQQLDLSKVIVSQVAKRRLPLNAPFVTGKRKATELEAKSAAQMFHRLLVRWPNEKETASERFVAFLPVILPGDSDLYLFLQTSNLLEEKPSSLGASLVEFASQSDRLLELRDILDQREPKGASNLSWLILRTQVAIAAKEMDRTVEFLGRLKEHIQGEKLLSNISHACHAAIPAFQIEELREAALPILKDYLAVSKRTGNYPDVDFSLFPLVREVNEYLKNKNK